MSRRNLRREAPQLQREADAADQATPPQAGDQATPAAKRPKPIKRRAPARKR